MGTGMPASLLAGVPVLPHEDPLFLPRVTTSAVSAAAAVTVPWSAVTVPLAPPRPPQTLLRRELVASILSPPCVLTALFLEASEQPC